MKVLQLFYKNKTTGYRKFVSSCQFHQGFGIENDCYARAGNPRQILIVSQSVLEHFNLQPEDLSGNLVINAEIETLKSGQILKLGTTATVRLMFRCEPCKQLDRVRSGLSKQLIGQRGFLAMVTTSGVVNVNDSIVIQPDRFPALSDEVKERFQEFVARIPPGKIVRSPDLILALGVSCAYYRALPLFLKQFQSQLPVHRIVTARGKLFENYIENQSQLLNLERVEVRSGQISTSSYDWNPEQFHVLKL